MAFSVVVGSPIKEISDLYIN